MAGQPIPTGPSSPAERDAGHHGQDVQFECDTIEEAIAVSRLLTRDPRGQQVDPAPRLAILQAMDDGERMTTTAIGQAVGKHPSSVEQMLYALKADGLVDFEGKRGQRQWWRTELPIPDTFTSSAHAKDADLFSDVALREAYGIPLVAPRPKRARLVRVR